MNKEDCVKQAVLVFFLISWEMLSLAYINVSVRQCIVIVQIPVESDTIKGITTSYLILSFVLVWGRHY